jgi:predicted PhzF superfamily epimerase YddE/YHI9
MTTQTSERDVIISLMNIWIVDAFTDWPYAGNPAGVAIVDEFPDDAQKIAMEMNLSETAFLKPISKNHYHLRWFTPKVEVKLCGHATLASAHLLVEEKLIDGDEILFDSLSGPLKVYSSPFPFLTLDFPLQKTGPSFPLPSFLHVGHVLHSVKAHDDVIVEVETEEEVRQFIPPLSLLEQIDCRGFILTAKAHSPYDFVSRFFAPRVGVNEDPVTGSAHCKLAHYWRERLGKSEFLAYQASERGGIIRLKIVNDRVHLTGQAVTVMKGKWRISSK